MYRIYTPLFFKWSAMTTWSKKKKKKTSKNRIQESLLPETKVVGRRGNLIGHSSYVPSAFNYIGAF